MKKDLGPLDLEYQDEGKTKKVLFEVYACDVWTLKNNIGNVKKGVIIQKGSDEKIICLEFDSVDWKAAKPFFEFYVANPSKTSDIIRKLYAYGSYSPTSKLPEGWKVSECTICLVFWKHYLK